MGLVLLYLKFDKPDSAFTHTLNNLRYYINCGIVVLICSAVLLIRPNLKLVLTAFLLTLPLNIGLQVLLPEMNYFVRAFWVISGLTIALIGSNGSLNPCFLSSSPLIQNQKMGMGFGHKFIYPSSCFH